WRGVAYRAVAGVRPLWWTPNLHVGRWHGPEQRTPVQYLALHPMGPLAEAARHAGLRSAAELRTLQRTVFALRIELEAVLRVDFATAHSVGLDAADMVGPPATYAACSAWLGRRLASGGALDALIVPSAALPGTENLVVL